MLMMFVVRGPARSTDAAGSTPVPETPSALTLAGCYRLALERSETQRIQEEQIEQAEARYRQALGSALPRVHVAGSELIQDVSGIGGGEGGVGGTLTRRERPEAKVVLRQPLFSGFREFAAMSSSKAEGRRERLLFTRASSRLLLDVAQAFYTVIQVETDLRNVQTLMALTQERIRELQGRVRLGKSRSSEVLSLESQLASQRAVEAALEGQRATAREILAFLIGQEVAQRPLTDTLPAVEAVEPEAQSLARAEQRSDVRAEWEEILARRAGVRLARGTQWPTASFLGNYYLKRVGFQSAIDWDVLLSVDVPVFQGGAARAQVRQAASELRAAEQQFAQRSRQARSEIVQTRLALETSLAQTKAFAEAYRKAKASYELHVKEYRLGLVNNLEVLQAMNMMQEAQRALDRALIQSKMDLLALNVATEELSLPIVRP